MYVRIIERAPTLRVRLMSACFARFFAEAEFANVVNRLDKKEDVYCLFQTYVSIKFAICAARD